MVTKAVIFDLNGIFIRSMKLSERFEKDFKIPISEFVPTLSEIMKKTREKNAPGSFQYWKEAFVKWKIEMSESDFWKYWFGAETVDEEMVALAKDLREKGIKIFILSNNFKERAEFYKEYPWVSDSIDKVYFSYHTGFVKPDSRAWQHILEENNLQAEDCIYFDDQESNTLAAHKIGIESYLFENVEKTKETIKRKFSLT